jgi:dTDP-glucose 4,6-dehydratase
MILVTGGCGFIGSAFVLAWLKSGDEPIVNLDLLTYAGHPGNLQEVAHHPNYRFVHGDIGDAALVSQLLASHQPRAVINFAAESHVDRSITGPARLCADQRGGNATVAAGHAPNTGARCRLIGGRGLPLPAGIHRRGVRLTRRRVMPPSPSSTVTSRTARTPRPRRRPITFVRAYHHTYGLPTLTTNCSNNYGPRQFPEKLIPSMILNALRGEPLPVYGDGQQVRDWLHVDDHCSAIRTVLARGRPGATYNIGGRSERANLEVVHTICRHARRTAPPRAGPAPTRQLVTHVKDRPGHDRRYAIDDRKIATELGWQPAVTFADGMRQTIEWYLANQAWVESVTSGSYRQWIDQQYQGLAKAA